ncbi:hypothetical protein PYCCODRAFT_1335341, partial [Trametes coccinea BRFM310]
MRIDGSTCAHTHLDVETGAILLRRLHPRIASYNDVVIFLMKCNMDIKHIGSGEAAKALLYYVTDYITKPSLPTHVGLGALSYAIQKTQDKFPGLMEESPLSDTRTAGIRGALTLTVNRMMSRQEISHQQVMSYLIGGGDVYRSHSFHTLHWGSFDRIFAASTTSSLETIGGDSVVNEQTSDDLEDTFTLKLESGTISSANQRQDYVYRSKAYPFDKMCLYEFVGTVEKISNHRDAREVKSVNQYGTSTREGAQPGNGLSYRGRKAEARGSFASEEHTQYHTHHLRRRTEWTIPIILGDRTPRSDRGSEEKEAWARMMLILFVPWRSSCDLRAANESWTAAFERHSAALSLTYLKIMENMNVLSECRDVRDAHRDMRRAEALAFLKAGLPAEDGHQHTGLDDENMHQDFQLYERPDSFDAYDDVEQLCSSQAALESTIGPRSREMIDLCYGDNSLPESEQHINLRAANDADKSSITLHSSVMRELKKQRRPMTETNESEDEARPKKRRRVNERTEKVSRSVLTIPLEPSSPDSTEREHGEELPEELVNRIAREMGLTDNVEQERAFRLVAEHVLAATVEDQLLMYIAGVGGTGKTHVVKAIVRLFDALAR